MRPATFARLTGVVYLLYFVTAFASAQLSGGVTSLGSVAAESIHRSTYEAGVAVGEVSTVLYLVLVVLLVRLLLAVSNTAAWLALVFGVTGCAITAIGAVFQHAALVDPDYLKLNAQALHVALVFFAGFDAFIGYLIYRSGFLPRIIGALMLLAGAGWFAALAPAVPRPVAIAVAVVGGGAEVVLMLWLLAFGVKDASAAAGGGDALAHHELAPTK